MTQTPLKPFQGELDKPSSVNQGLKPFDGALDGESASPGLLRSAGDSAVALGSGITQGVKMLTDVAGADNAASRVLGEATDALTDLSSPYAKAKKQERAEKIKAAEDSGSTWEEVKAYAGSFADAPLDTTLNALGTSAAPIVAGTLSGVAAIPVAAVRAAQIGLAAAQGVGGIKGQIHESVKQKHLEAGATEAEAAKRADAAQAYTGPNAGSIALGGVLGAAAGGTGAESAVRRLAGQRLAAEAAEKVAPGVVRSAVAGAAKEAPMEMLQGGQERHASNTALQGEGFDVPTWQGVAGQAALEGLASAPMGGGFGAMEGMAHKGATQRQGEGGAAFTSGASRTPPDSIKSVVAKAQWVRGWDEAAANALKSAGDATGAAVAASESQPGEQAWTTSAGAAAEVEPGTAQASPANAPNLDYETLPGAAPEAQGNEIDFTRDFPAPEWGTKLGAAGQQPAATAAPELTPSQAMGLDPNAGALSKAAAMAVDSGASPVVQPQVAPVQQHAAPQVPAGVDPDTGEVSLQAQMDELKSRIAFMQQQGAAQGWDGNRAAQRNALQTQLTRLELQAAGGQERGASTAGAPAPVQLTGINQILAKQIPDMNEQELQQAIAHYGPTHKRTKKLEKALQALAQKPLTAIESGANANVPEADQAQQGSAQPSQAGAAQAGQDADQGVGNGTTPVANPGAQEPGASLAKAQAQVSEAAGAAQAAVGKAAQIAREGNAEREAQRQRQLDASERWTRMTTAERQAVAATAPGLTVIARKNVHTRAWPDLGEKIREKLLDSLVAPLVESTSKAPAAIENAAKPAPNSVSGDALTKPAAQPVGDEKPFTAETGTLGIPRAEMPQVPTANHGGLVKHLKAQGISHETTTVDAAQLKPTQAEYSPSKVEAAKSSTGDRAVIVSSDGHIIDGHHQAVAAAEEGKQVRAIVLDAPVEKALAAVKASPSANTDAVAAPLPEPVTVPKSVPQRMKEAKAAKEAASAVAPKPKSVPEKMREAAAARADKPAFRREAADAAMGADFDVASFLQIMNEGQPAPSGSAAAAAPSMNVRPSYSPAARAEAVRAVKGTADAIRKAWANGPEVIVAFDMQDAVVPESARRADLKQRSGGARGAPEGFYYQGKVYLMASKLKTPNDAARVLFHEALGHHGLRGLFGKDLGLILNQVATMRKADVDAKIAEYGLRRVNRLDRRTAAEEVLAEMAQNTPQIGFVRRAVAAIRTWLRTNVPGFKSLALTDAELIRNFILPARAWVERGTVADMSQDVAFSRTSATSMPDAIIGSTLGTASSHPDYAAAKGGDIEAAVRLAMDLVTPELMAKVKAAIGDSKPLVVPVAAEEASGRNKIPRAAAEVLAHRLGLKAANGIVQANRARRTGMDGLDRIFAPVDFAGAVEAKPYLLVDDTLTQGGTFAALASHIREGGGTVAGVIALTGKQYSAKIQPSPETLASLRQKHGDLENEYRAATGYGFDALTESEARYLARYEPADRLRDRISDEGRRGREREDQSNPGQADPDADEGLRFSRSRLSEIRDSALDQLSNAFTHEGKVSLWDKSVGTMRHLAERAPSFKPVYESAQQNIDDVSMLANDAADMAPRILPRVESLGDLKKKPVSAADNKAVARPLFEGTLIWARDENGKPTLVDDLQKRYANLSAHNKAAMLLKHGKIKSEVLAMWQGLPVAQFEKNINARFENKMLKPGIVWTDAELQAQFGTDANQISLYREARAAIDRSIDMTARTDMLRVVGEKYEPMRDAVLAQPSVEAAAQLLLDTLEQDAKADPDSRERLAGYMQLINRRLDTAVDLQQGGYAPLSRFGRYTVDVVDANGDRLYFGMYETARDSNRAKMQLAQEFKGATITTGTMSAEAYKLFAGVTPETLEQFGEMLGLKAEGNEAQDKAFQEFLKLTKNNHSAMKRLIHRKGIAGFSEDVGRVVANFVYSNARAGAMGLNAGKMETAIGKIPKEQGELKDLAMGLRDYIRDPQEEGQAVRGMLFAQYLGGSIASAFVNTTQPFAVTLPWLSQYGGMKKAGAQLARALKDMGTKGFKYEADLAKALQSAEDDGVVSPQEIHQLMAQARGAGMLRSGDGTKAGDLRAKAGNLWEQGKVLWGQPFALAEQFNRRSTFIASYRIAKDQGMADPATFARKAVLETQFVYSKANKPKWARGAVGGTLFCVDDTTEALTSQGWKTVDDLRQGDLIASFDMTTESLVWKPVNRVYQKCVSGEMVHIKDRNLDMFMTPDHRVVTYREERVPGQRNKYHRRLQIQEAQDLNSKDCIPVAAPFLHEPAGVPLSDEQVRMIGWIVTEGYFVKKNRGRAEWGGHLRIGQNEGGKADLIRRDLAAAGLPWVEHKWKYNGGNAVHVYFNVKKSACADLRSMVPGKVLTPDLLMRMTTDQIRQLVEVMVVADGSTSKTGKRCFIQNPGQTLDAFQMALTMIGVAFSVHHHGPGARKVVLKDAKWYTLSRTKGERVQFEGRVWCPLVQDTHTWVARRGGRVFITHNTFKTYSVSYLELMQRMWTQGGPEGKRAVGWALAMLLLMSGAGGVPFMEDAEDLIDGAGQMMGYNISAKQWRKELLANVVGKELGEFMEQGLSGLPGASIDVSGRLGMGNLLPGTGLFLSKPNRERDLMEIVGPAGDLVARGFTGARKLLGGDVAGAALEVSPTAVRNLAKGADMAATGMYRDTKGYKVIDTTLAEAAAKAIGFQPKSVAEVQEANSFMQRSKSFYTQTSSEIKAQWADALFRKDEAAVQRVRERLADWNRDNPEQPIVVKMPDVWKRVREMGKDRSDRIADTAPKALREQMRKEVAVTRNAD